MTSMPKIETEWQHFKALTADGLYKLPAVSRVDLVVEQRSAYPDLDGLDRQALHLLLRMEGASLTVCACGRFRCRLVAAALRRRRVGRRLMREAL